MVFLQASSNPKHIRMLQFVREMLLYRFTTGRGLPGILIYYARYSSKSHFLMFGGNTSSLADEILIFVRLQSVLGLLVLDSLEDLVG